jgi:hypothetical protein
MTSADRAPDQPDADVVTLCLVHQGRVDVARVPDRFKVAQLAWLGRPLPDAADGSHRFACDLELPVGALGSHHLRKAAVVGLRSPLREGEGWLVPIEWHAATFSPLFPVFLGCLQLEPERLVLTGRYRPPGGRLGMAADAVFARAAAREVARWFLERVAAALA